MKTLLDAIYLQFTGSPTLTAAFPGGVHRDLAPENTANPYVVSTMVAAPSQAMYGTNRRADVYVRFSAVGVGHDATLALIETFTGVFDDSVLSLTSGQNYDALRVSDPVGFMEPKVNTDGDEVWRWTVEYRYSVRT